MYMKDILMTKDEFQSRYANYTTHIEADAREEAKKVNAEGIDGDLAVAVKFGERWYLVSSFEPCDTQEKP